MLIAFDVLVVLTISYITLLIQNSCKSVRPI